MKDGVVADSEEAAGPTLDEADVRKIVRLLADVASSRRDITTMKRQLMDGLCGLIQADSWAWSLGCELEAGKQPTYLSLSHGGFDEARFTKLLCGTVHPDMAKISEAMLGELQRKKSHVTRLHQQVIQQDEFIASGVYPHLCAADIGPFLLSLRPIDARSVSTVVVYRRMNQPDFTERESRIAHILLTEVPWLHEEGLPEDRGTTVPRLSPREKLILNLLLDGCGRKAIAGHLDLAENTVAGYQKSIYRHFKVNSHAALMRRFRQSDGGDR